ncbi:ROK family protein [Novosphingobium beihaiensis]|uniref:fructokinase n=1 Tax=Novosphingobium beihaiensis TaxID=2930389 RepID=A0ABT0BRL3_9SPHN|nr:ROK family protein [Novosphingobium beihaiensis]MCJ2187684.1 ROK family protein [Novosphingobium beihaiensis]
MTRPAPPIAGIELGGTKCICTLANGPQDIREQHSVATQDPATTLAGIRAVLERWWHGPGFRALGIASFGPLGLDRARPDFGHVLATTKPGWAGADVAGTLSRGFAVPLSFDTDVNGAAMAELRWGAGRGLADFAYVTVGTGVGVGLIVNGAPVRGFGHCEMGHLRVPRLPGDTLPSSCAFHEDCVEGLASGSALKLVLGGRSPAGLTPQDPLWDRITDAVAKLCHAMASTTAPLRIAIGGGVFAAQPHLLPRIEPALRASLNGYLALPEGPYVVAPELGTLAGPLGPIALALGADVPV